MRTVPIDGVRDGNQYFGFPVGSNRIEIEILEQADGSYDLFTSYDYWEVFTSLVPEEVDK